MASKALQRRREALAWVVGHLPNSDTFTTHEVMLMAEILESVTWPPYYKGAWRKITSDGPRSLGSTLSRHPQFAKVGRPTAMSSHGQRIRTQTWQNRAV